MLTDTEMGRLNRLLPSEHLLLELENWIVTEAGSRLRKRLNQGKTLTEGELLALSHSESLGEVKITEADDMQWLTAFAIAVGRDLQSIFETDSHAYYTLFIDSSFINEQVRALLDKYGLLRTFQTNPSASIALSFPARPSLNRLPGSPG